MAFLVNDVYEKAKSLLADEWDITFEGSRVIITCRGIFKCFISRALEIKSRKYILSAHMLLLTNKISDSIAKIQFWKISDIICEDVYLKKIFEDLKTLQMIYS